MTIPRHSQILRRKKVTAPLSCSDVRPVLVHWPSWGSQPMAAFRTMRISCEKEAPSGNEAGYYLIRGDDTYEYVMDKLIAIFYKL